MERKNKIKISFDSTLFTHVFIHTSGAYINQRVSQNNNKYLSNFKNLPSAEELKDYAKAINNATLEDSKQQIMDDLNSRIKINQNINVESITFMDNVQNLKGYIVFEPISALETSDLSLLDFLNFDFNNINEYLVFFINYFDYFINKMSNDDLKYIKIDTLYPVEEIVNLAKKYYEVEKENLIRYQDIFKKCVDFVYCIDNPYDVKDLTLKQRFFLYNKLYPDTFKEFSHDFHTTDLLEYKYLNFPSGIKDVETLIKTIADIDPSGRQIANLHQFVTSNLFTSFYISLFNIIAVNKMHIKICNNCKRYFITQKENVAYCDRIIIDNVTCKTVGSMYSQKRKEENDPVYKKSRKILSKLCMRVSRNPDIEKYSKEYEKFKDEVESFKSEIEKGNKTIEEFDKWLDENK